VRLLSDGLVAIHKANADSAKAKESAKLCPASAIKAKLLDLYPISASHKQNVKVIAVANHIVLLEISAPCECEPDI
jgi:hypothetical protein